MMFVIRDVNMGLFRMGSFFFGLLSAILLGTFIFLCVMGDYYEATPPQNGNEINNFYFFHNGALLYGIASLLFILISLIALTFTIVLIIGVSKNRPGMIKCYIVFGCVLTALFVISDVIAIAMKWDNPDVVMAGAYVLVGAFIYSLILIMIRKAYIEIKTGVQTQKQFQHKMLVEGI